MGLDTTHDCWHGSYSSFDRFRCAYAETIGLDLNSMRGHGGTTAWESLKPDPLYILLHHSDCDGEIEWFKCGILADRMEELIPLLPDYPTRFDDEPESVKDIWRDRAADFVKGLRSAYKAKENVEFN